MYKPVRGLQVIGDDFRGLDMTGIWKRAGDFGGDFVYGDICLVFDFCGEIYLYGDIFLDLDWASKDA